MRVILLFFMAAFLLATTPAAAEQVFHAKPRLISPQTAAGSAETIPVAVDIALEPGWHAYWRTPGDAGLAPAFDWSGSQNLKSAAVRWPAPIRFTVMDIDNFGYEKNVTFPIDITPQQRGGALALNLKLDLLVCSDICVPETHRLTLELPAGEAALSADQPLYDTALKKLPVADSAGIRFDALTLAYDRDNRNYAVIEATPAGVPAMDGDLFIEHPSQVTFGKPAVSYDAARGKLTFRSEIRSTEPLDRLKKDLSAAPFTLTYTGGLQAVEAQLPLAAAPAAEVPEKAAEKIRSVDLRIILLALLGGLILNLMPCVLPVLSLKILSVVSHGGKDSRATIFRNFMASAAGIVFSFWLLAAGLVALKAAGQQIGWGIQFQHPAFLIFLIAVLLVFSANMLDLFEIPLPRFIARHIARRHEHEPTLAGHFLTGAFATLLATPCTAPFLGTAIGFALARGAYEIFTVFTFLGIGLALPYIALAVMPRLFKYMPKPGAWMVKLRRVMAMALLATAVWLGTVLYSITTTPAMAPGWESFDQAAIQSAVAEGKTVIVDVTADWCLTCKANKKLVLETDTIAEALAAPNIVKMQADWTQRDESIGAYLATFGRYGIPFNIVYGPAAPEGIVLPELLTQSAVLGAIAEAAGE